ncbi:PREDICTED: myosin-2 essential light chain [Drosophila arizonae]|uniref:Myosin-2 essential light chain n=1 Tax=Drosophila arizonae TaxID=7263 RepID=A0ABM1NQ00_DROAR|nr:PREDICTED: myosin-2 essential light chain [Drosophila arizonae]
MANKESPAELKRMRQLLQQFDQCDDGKIELSQLGECLRVLGANPSERCVRQHVRQLRAGHIERVPFDEVMSIHASIVSSTRKAAKESRPDTIAEQLILGLRFFDEHNTGFISAARLARVLTTCGERLTKEEMNELLVGRVNDQGLVNYVEFVHAITSSK